MTYTIIDPTAEDYQRALADEERKLEQAKQRLLDLEEVAWKLCLEYASVPKDVRSKARNCSNTKRTIEALRELAKQVNFPEGYKL